MSNYLENTSTITTCLIDGVEHTYDMCSESRHCRIASEQLKRWKYMGSGTIHRIGAVIQSSQKTYHFWKEVQT